MYWNLKVEEDYLKEDGENKEIKQLENNLEQIEKGIDDEDYMEGGDDDDSDESSDDDKNLDGGRESDNADDSDDESLEEDPFLKSVREQIRSAEDGNIKAVKPVKPVEVAEIKEEPSKQEVQEHSIPKAENDTEIKKIISGGKCGYQFRKT